MTTLTQPSLDYALVGGGLGNALIALAIFDAQPNARVALVERSEAVGGNHLWCFHAGDVEGDDGYIRPLISASWPGYDVRFPQLTSALDEPYRAVRSERLASVVSAAFAARPGSELLLGAQAVGTTAHSVTIGDGRELHAQVVIESRGPEQLAAGERAGYQKFLGLELKLKRPCPIQRPLLMDARVPQRDGFRFMYALPFGSDRVLLEDTYFSDSPELDRERLQAEIIGYAEQNGFDVDYVAREEVGVLPLPTRMPQLRAAPGRPLLAGYQGGWFHPVTGYSFPVAARVARAVASTPAAELRQRVWPSLVRAQRAQLRFCILLNRLFFGAFAPGDRRNVIERFYRLKPELVRRFYALNMTHADRARIVCGKPPRGFSLRLAFSGGSGSASPEATSTTEGVLS